VVEQQRTKSNRQKTRHIIYKKALNHSQLPPTFPTPFPPPQSHTYTHPSLPASTTTPTATSPTLQSKTQRSVKRVTETSGTPQAKNQTLFEQLNHSKRRKNKNKNR